MIEHIRRWIAKPPRALRVAWIVVQLVATSWMSQLGIQFYYQGF